MKRVNYPMTCIICGKLSKRLGSHVVNKHKVTSQQYYDTYLKKENEGKCIMCGKETPFISITTGYQLHCCAKCGLDDPKTREHFESTMIQKYGVAYASQCDDFVEKSKQTKLEKYGDENYNNRDKTKETCINRYGVEFPNQSDEVKEKIRQTNLKRRNVGCSFQDKEVVRKSRKARILNNHGSNLENYMMSKLKELKINFEIEYDLDSRYPYFCDFYLPDTDTFIEINGFWMHGGHFFNENDQNDINRLNLWIEKAKNNSIYQRAIDCWTKYDLERKDCAIKNNLNYVVLWNKTDIDEWIKNNFL